MSDRMTFPDTVEEFMEQYKVVDTDGVYMSKGAELVPIFRMKQWFEQLPSAQPVDKDINVPVKDCISRHAAIDALKNDMASLDHIIKGMSAYDVRLDAYVSQRNQVNCDIYTINNLPAVQSEQRWIPVSDRLPEGQTEVIVSCMDNSGDTGFLYTSSGWMTTDREYWIVDNEINSFVIAWMPMPEPWRGKGEK